MIIGMPKRLVQFAKRCEDDYLARLAKGDRAVYRGTARIAGLSIGVGSPGVAPGGDQEARIRKTLPRPSPFAHLFSHGIIVPDVMPFDKGCGCSMFSDGFCCCRNRKI